MENFRNIFESRYTWIEGFMRNVRRYGNRTAMISPSDNQSWTYRELDVECNRFSNALMDEITQMAVALPEHTVVPYPNIPKKAYPKNIPLEVYSK